MTARITLCCLLLVGTAALVVPQTSLAQSTTGPGPGLRSGLFHLRDTTRASAGIDRIDDPVAVVLRVINIVLALVAVIATGVMIWAGLSYILAAGDEDKLQKAKRIILYTIIGLIIIGMAAIVVNLVLNIFTSSS